MLKKLMVLVTAAVLAGGVFLTAQGLSSHQTPLPRVAAPITVKPAADRNTTGPPTATPTATSPTDQAQCRDDDDAYDDNGDRSDDRHGDDCDHMQTVVPTPNVLGEDHHGRDDRVGDDDAPGSEDHHGGQAGDDDAPGSEDHHGGHGGSDDGGGHGGRH